jgi:hypothetical protein
LCVFNEMEDKIVLYLHIMQGFEGTSINVHEIIPTTVTLASNLLSLEVRVMATLSYCRCLVWS